MKIDFKMRSTNFECVTFWRDSVAFQTDFFVIRCASVFCVLPALTWVARILIESGKKTRMHLDNAKNLRFRCCNAANVKSIVLPISRLSLCVSCGCLYLVRFISNAHVNFG